MGPGHVGSIPLLATRLEQATAAEGIIRPGGLPGIDAVRPREGATCCGFPNPATKPGHTGQNRARWPAVDERGRADGTVSGPPCPAAPGQARVAVDEDEHGGSDRETDNNDHP
jgi:hypothetical protein